MRWMNHKKSRVMDFFRRIDKDQDGKVTRQEFIEGILSSSKCFRAAGSSEEQRGAVGRILTFNPLPRRIPHQPSGDERRGGHIRPGRRRLHRLLRVCGGASSQQGRVQTADGRRQNRRRGKESSKWAPNSRTAGTITSHLPAGDASGGQMQMSQTVPSGADRRQQIPGEWQEKKANVVCRCLRLKR